MNHDHHDQHDHNQGTQTAVDLARADAETDPVCGMTVDPATAAGSVTRNGTTYFFCSRHCLAKFAAEPAKYSTPAAKPEGHSRSNGAKVPRSSQAQAAGATKWSCPMHPEVVRDGPGACPKCGMALEPVIPRAGEEEDSELRDMRRRFVVAAVLTLPVFALAMAPMIPGVTLPPWLKKSANWTGLVLATPVVFWAGWPFFVRAAQALRHRTANMFTLIALGTGAAWGTAPPRPSSPPRSPPGSPTPTG